MDSRCCSLAFKISRSPRTGASVLFRGQRRKKSRGARPRAWRQAAAGMDAEAAAKARPKRLPPTRKGRRGACKSCRCRARARACAEERARREHNSAAKGEASAAAASAKQTKRPPAPAMNSSAFRAWPARLKRAKAAAEHRRKKAAQDARAAKLAAEVAKKKAVAEALANRGAKKRRQTRCRTSPEARTDRSTAQIFLRLAAFAD